MAAYDILVRRFGGIFFGWLDWGWLEVDDDENHVILISAIIGGAFHRVYFRYAPETLADGTIRRGFRVVRETLSVMVLFAVLMALLPAPFGLAAGLGIEALALYWLIDLRSYRIFKTPDPFLEELLSILVILLIIIVLNYTIFIRS